MQPNAIYLSRAEAATFLQRRGYPIQKTTLQKFASVGGGPPFRKFGGRVLYTEEELISWAEARTTESIPHVGGLAQ